MQAIVATFDRSPIFALGMSHRQQDAIALFYLLADIGTKPKDDGSCEADFSLALVRDPHFAATVNDIVVECGKVLYQATFNRYIDGGEMPLKQLQLVWRSTARPGSCDPRQHNLYLGPIASIHQVEFPHEIGTAYARELDRRRSLLGGSPIPIAPASVPQ